MPASNGKYRHVRCRKKVSDLIYENVKKGKKVSREAFYEIVNSLFDKGCDTVILGCTELSVINKDLGGDERLTDSLEVLAYTAIKLCGKEPTGFNKTFNR